MNSVISVTIDDQKLDVKAGSTVLDVCREAGIKLPVLCDFKGLASVGACRLCLVEIEGIPKLLPACTTRIQAEQAIHTRSPRLMKYRRLILELLFSEGNHVCSVCVSNDHCELQTLATSLGMDHVRFSYLFQPFDLDASHPQFVMDAGRCVLCTRCVRVCAEVEGAHAWGVVGRGFQSRIVSDFNQPWGDSESCTSCGKCVEICPTGALWDKRMTQGAVGKKPERVSELVEKRRVS